MFYQDNHRNNSIMLTTHRREAKVELYIRCLDGRSQTTMHRAPRMHFGLSYATFGFRITKLLIPLYLTKMCYGTQGIIVSCVMLHHIGVRQLKATITTPLLPGYPLAPPPLHVPWIIRKREIKEKFVHVVIHLSVSPIQISIVDSSCVVQLRGNRPVVVTVGKGKQRGVIVGIAIIALILFKGKILGEACPYTMHVYPKVLDVVAPSKFEQECSPPLGLGLRLYPHRCSQHVFSAIIVKFDFTLY